MNTITHAFKQSGVQLPTINKRIWLWLNDHPGKTSKEIAAALGMAHNNTSSQLTGMVNRKMVVATETRHQHRAQNIRRYSTCIKEYELLPLPTAVKLKAVTAAPALVEQPKPAVTLPAVPKPLLGVLENYTLKELRVIRDGLNKLFEHV